MSLFPHVRNIKGSLSSSTGSLRSAFALDLDSGSYLNGSRPRQLGAEAEAGGLTNLKQPVHLARPGSLQGNLFWLLTSYTHRKFKDFQAERRIFIRRCIGCKPSLEEGQPDDVHNANDQRIYIRPYLGNLLAHFIGLHSDAGVGNERCTSSIAIC